MRKKKFYGKEKKNKRIKIGEKPTRECKFYWEKRGQTPNIPDGMIIITLYAYLPTYKYGISIVFSNKANVNIMFVKIFIVDIFYLNILVVCILYISLYINFIYKYCTEN